MISQIKLIGVIAKYIEKHGVKNLNARQMNAIIEGTLKIANELETPHKPATPGMGISAWLACDETGTSSRYLLHTLAGPAGVRVHDPKGRPREMPYPRDPGDFGRCVGLLDAESVLRQHLPVMSEGHGPEWAALVTHWGELEAIYREELPLGNAPRLYARMKELLGVDR